LFAGGIILVARDTTCGAQTQPKQSMSNKGENDIDRAVDKTTQKHIKLGGNGISNTASNIINDETYFSKHIMSLENTCNEGQLVENHWGKIKMKQISTRST
jgi:hypothetical protein